MPALTGTVSYGLAAVAFAVLLLLLVIGHRARAKGGLLIAACLATVVWALGNGLTEHLGGPAIAVSQAVGEVLRVALWLAFLASLLAPASGGAGRRFPPQALLALAGIVASTVAVALRFVWAEGLVFSHIGFLVAALAGLVLVEQIYRGVHADQRWNIKHLCIGLGVVYIYEFYMFANALLFGDLTHGVWAARGVVNAFAVPLVAVSAARNPAWAVDVGVSRRIVVDSALLSGAGLYLLFMAAAGYYIRYAGGSWGGVLQIAFLVAALMLLLVAVFSGSFRAWLRVFVSKHFFSYKYDYREEWLRFIGTLSDTNAQDPLRVRAVRALADIMDSPAGALWNINEYGNYELGGTWNLQLGGALTEPGDSALVQFLEGAEWIVDLDEFSRSPERYEKLELPRTVAEIPRAWLIVPLMQLERLEGFVVLTKPKVPREINWEDRDLLKTAGRQVASYTALVGATSALIDARQFDAFNRLSAYVVHDLKNVVAQLSLVASNGEKFKDDPAFVDDAFKTVNNATAKMQRILQNLRKPPEGPEDLDLVGAGEVIAEAVQACRHRQPVPREGDVDAQLKVAVPRNRCVTILEHLLRNAQEATPDEGAITVSARQEDGRCLIEIRDSGVGMDEAFIRDQLFKPFDTTKGNAGMGLGMYEAKQMVEGVGGVLNVLSKPGQGTSVQLRFQVASANQSPEHQGKSHRA